ncbi:hypothetical protein AAF712_004435 [Marasmius tenuissimus]|uniref:AAA-ATPase-like domain-containing protein n=1 Tax=Marasmius tenuissimus TaxID=585030 RepID=A0ABR3A2Z1_9AGAR
MFKYHFGIFFIEMNFEDVFQYTQAIHREWQPNTYWVLELDLGGLDVEAENFDMNGVINEGLRRFVEKYSFLHAIEKKWEELKTAVAARTLDNMLHTIVVLIDNYDTAFRTVRQTALNSDASFEKYKALESALGGFFDALAYWTQLRQISRIFLAGTEQVLFSVSKRLFHRTRDVVVKGFHMTDLFGFCEQDVVDISSVLDYEFHGLRAAEWADKFLESQEAKREFKESGGHWYRLSCRTVLNFHQRKLAQKMEDLPDVTPELCVPLRYE